MPVIVKPAGPVRVVYKTVVENINVSQIVVGEGVLENLSIGQVYGNRISYVRLIALDVYDNGVWRLSNEDKLEEILVPARTAENNTTGSTIVFRIRDLDYLPTVKPSYKVIPIPQPAVYSEIDNAVLVRAPRALKDPYNRFIALRTLYMYNGTYSVIIPSGNTLEYTKPYPEGKIAARILDHVVTRKAVIDMPSNESTWRVRKVALEFLSRYWNKPLRTLIDTLIDYIRANKTYTPTPPKTPTGEDLVDYFLFKSHKGSCLHYASALAVVLRNMGLRSRVVLGYIVDNVNGTQRIRGIPHLWVELYVPGTGWIQVDPTPPSSITTPSPTIFENVDEKVRRYVNETIEEALKEYRRSLVEAKLRGQREPTSTSETVNNTSTHTLLERIYPIIEQYTIPLALIILAIASTTITVKLGYYGTSSVDKVKYMLHRIADKVGVRVDVEYMTPREVVEKIVSRTGMNTRLELYRFLELYEKARYGGGRKDLVDEAVRVLDKVYRMV